MKKRISTILLILVFLVGLSLLLYPTISNYWNSRHQSKAIAGYVEEVYNMQEEKCRILWNDAVAYNEALSKIGNQWTVGDDFRANYRKQLDISGNGIMGYIEIPDIGCSLPIYHGTDDSVLQIAVGHLEGTSLPAGGLGSHCVLSGHRGLPSADLFTDIDKLAPGDVFTLNVLDQTLTYEVFEILTVLPHELDALKIESDRDLCTLVTCTPYGINTHRLLVKAQRIENAEETVLVRVTADAMQIEPIIVAPVIAVPMLLVLFVILLVQPKKKK
ncbi:MAG: class C sortase [Ruminococcaceae bacterium]|nr:class C sortase [Oscillospiraceae bacterium]